MVGFSSLGTVVESSAASSRKGKGDRETPFPLPVTVCEGA